MARRKKGNANADENASMPTVGHNHSPLAAATSTKPTKATLQVKNTVVDVIAATATAM